MSGSEPRRITRQASHPGMPVTVTWLDGGFATGRLASWGDRTIRICTADGNVEQPVTVIDKVFEAGRLPGRGLVYVNGKSIGDGYDR